MLAQVSEGWPNDDKEDLDLPIWAGVLPITQVSLTTHLNLGPCHSGILLDRLRQMLQLGSSAHDGSTSELQYTAQVIGAPEADELCQEKGYAVPDYVSSYQRPSVL